MINSNSTSVPPRLIELINCVLLTCLNGLLNKTKHNASRMVDLPEPFSPIINVVGFLSNSTSVK